MKNLMDEGVIQICQAQKMPEIAVIEPCFNLPAKLEVCYNGETERDRRSTQAAITIQLPAPFAYDNTKAVPWRYEPMIEENGILKPINDATSTVENITGPSKMTHSGLVFGTSEPLVVDPQPTMPAVTRKTDAPVKEAVINDNAAEFLKIIRKSDYRVMDQLHQTPSKISILSLLLNSEAHRTALMKVLEQAHVGHDITVNQFDGIVNHITSCGNLSFTDEDLTEEGRDHNRALHISVKCANDSMSRVLVDTGSSLNVMPKTTLNKLAYQGVMKPSALVVKAFDGSRRTVIGEIELPIKIGPQIFQILFQVMDINPAYSCLLGRPWIHAAGGSNLYSPSKVEVHCQGSTHRRVW